LSFMTNVQNSDL